MDRLFRVKDGYILAHPTDITWLREDDDQNVYISVHGEEHKLLEDATLWTITMWMEGIDE